MLRDDLPECDEIPANKRTKQPYSVECAWWSPQYDGIPASSAAQSFGCERTSDTEIIQTPPTCFINHLCSGDRRSHSHTTPLHRANTFGCDDRTICLWLPRCSKCERRSYRVWTINKTTTTTTPIPAISLSTNTSTSQKRTFLTAWNYTLRNEFVHRGPSYFSWRPYTISLRSWWFSYWIYKIIIWVMNSLLPWWGTSEVRIDHTIF